VKITFEGPNLNAIIEQMEFMLHEPRTPTVAENAAVIRALADKANAPVDTPVDTPVDKPVEKPAKPAVSEKKLAAAAKMRAAKEAKANAKKAAKEVAIDTAAMMEQPPPPKTAEGMDPAEVVRVRQKTIEELQAAYANGFQKEVFELLARFGNGAKSFRELSNDAFVPIREAIDNGALT
jgi:hypothetical protein